MSWIKLRSAVSAVLVGASCSALPGRIALAPHLAPTHGPEAATELRIAVAPFRDERTELSHQLVRPPLQLVLLGALRSGEYATGDASFAGAIADYARADAEATLAHSGLFAEVRHAESLAGSLGVPPADLLLTGEVEEFVGIQNRRLEINLLRVPLLRTRSETPIGVARVLYRVLDAQGRVRFEKRIETQITGTGLDFEQAALDALAGTNEALANDLYRLFVPQPRVRSVPLLALDACGLGEKTVRRLLEDASEVLEREAGLRLEPQLATWQRPLDAVTPNEVLAAVKRLPPPAGGVLLALVPSSEPRMALLRREQSGLATQLGRHAIVACGPDESLRTVTVVHELGHLFGAVHVGERSSIMYPVAEFDARFFDELNRRVLQAARLRDFGEPPSAQLRAELRALYESADGTKGLVSAKDREAALRAVR